MGQRRGNNQSRLCRCRYPASNHYKERCQQDWTGYDPPQEFVTWMAGVGGTDAGQYALLYPRQRFRAGVVRERAIND